MNPFGQAQWIWTEQETVNQYAEFETAFTVNGDGRAATLYVSADNEYAAYLNGVFAGYNQYDDFPTHKAYNAHEVGALLREGENTLLIRAYHQGDGSFQYLPGPAGVIFRLDAGETAVESGEATKARPCALYESGAIEKVSGQLGYTFHADAAKADDTWQKPRIVTERADTELYPRPVKQLETMPAAEAKIVAEGWYLERGGDTSARRIQRAYLAAKDRADDGENEGDGRYYVFDLGREEAGLPYLEAECDAEAEILVGYGEHLDDLRVRAWVGGRNFAFSYRAKKGHNEFTHYFRRIAGRYLQAFVPAGVTLTRLTLLPVLYPTEERGAFRSGDEMMNRIFDISRRTLRLCMHEHYEDSPWREQGLYAMDSRNQALCGYLALGERDFAAACLKLMAEGRREDGLMEICAPARADITIPSFSLGWVISLRDMALYTGLLDRAKELLPAAEDMLGFFRKRMRDGLTVTPTEKCFWNFYEWAPGLDDGWDYGKGYENKDGNRRDAPLNMLFSYALSCAAQVYEWTGDSVRAQELRQEQAALNEAVNRAFWDEDEQLYRTYTGVKAHYCELTQALALLCGAAEKPLILCEALANRDERLIPATLSYALFKYEALIAYGDYRAAAVRDCRETWAKMVAAGATSFWETIEGADAFSYAGSLCHGWSAVPAWLWFAGLLGVQPTRPGFAEFTFQPLPEWQGEATVPTPYGDMKITGNEIAYCKEQQIRR